MSHSNVVLHARALHIRNAASMPFSDVPSKVRAYQGTGGACIGSRSEMDAGRHLRRYVWCCQLPCVGISSVSHVLGADGTAARTV